MAKVGLSSPWVQFYHKVEAFFKNDSEVSVVYDEEKNQLKLYVDNAAKADALSMLIPAEKKFGKTTLEISVVPSNRVQKRKGFSLSLTNNLDILTAAFENNKSAVLVTEIDIYTTPLIYVVFYPEVVQYFTDSLGDINGLCSTLMQDLAKEIFTEISGVCYCTDKIVTNTISTCSTGDT